MNNLLISLIAAMVITTQAQPALGVYDYAQTFTTAVGGRIKTSQ